MEAHNKNIYNKITVHINKYKALGHKKNKNSRGHDQEEREHIYSAMNFAPSRDTQTCWDTGGRHILAGWV